MSHERILRVHPGESDAPQAKDGLIQFISPEAKLRIRLKSAADNLNRLLLQHKDRLAEISDTWLDIVDDRFPIAGHGFARFIFRAKKTGETFELQFDHRREETRMQFSKLDHRKTLLTVSDDGEILSVQSGKAQRSNAYKRHEPEYLSVASPAWEQFEPDVNPITELSGKVSILEGIVEAFSGAYFGRPDLLAFVN